MQAVLPIVNLVDYNKRALELLIFTKETRLTGNNRETLETIAAWPQDRKDAALRHMRHTIKSQFEFVDYIFEISNVSRAFTQQLERHRVGTSFAERSLRVVDATDFNYVKTGNSDTFDNAMSDINDHYLNLRQEGQSVEDARGILPINVATSIVVKGNLRTLHEMAGKRLCVRTQGEFQNVFKMMRARVLEVHPWADEFLRVYCATTGVCQFHDFPVERCEIKGMVFNPETGMRYDRLIQSPDGPARPATLVQIQTAWANMKMNKAAAPDEWKAK